MKPVKPVKKLKKKEKSLSLFSSPASPASFLLAFLHFLHQLHCLVSKRAGVTAFVAESDSPRNRSFETISAVTGASKMPLR